MKRKIDKLRKDGIGAVLTNEDSYVQLGYVYQSLFGEKICVTCESVVRKAFDKVMALTWDEVKVMRDKKFKLKTSKLIDRTMARSGPVGMYNTANITDEISIQLLRISKAYLQYFESYPKNWESLVTGNKKK